MGPGVTRPAVTADDLLDAAEVASMLGVQPSTLRAMRAQPQRHRRIDGLPEPLRMVGNSPVWDAHAVRAWLAGKG